MKVIVKEDYDEISRLAAKMIAEVVKKKPDAVLGLATGSTPVGTYRELIRMHKEDGLDFSRVLTFNLDEYRGLKPDHPASYHYFMRENLFRDINIKPANTHVPDGLGDNIEESCKEYEKAIVKAGGIDIQVLGIGGNGHIGFNEPSSPLSSRTRKQNLDARTIRDNARFFKSMDEVPKSAITMGIGTIMEARQILLLANGGSKADAIARTVEGPVTESVPASVLQRHANATIIIDRAAASKLAGRYP